MASTFSGGPDPTLYLYTSLTAGSSHIITATSRLETILKANKIPFRAIDCATDEKARTLWSRRSKNRKIPGLVKYGQVIGDLNEVEEWNEYGEIKDNIDNVSDLFGDTPMTDTPMAPPAPITIKDPLARAPEPASRSSSQSRHISISEPKERERESSVSAKNETPLSMAMRQAGAEAAAKAGQKKATGSGVVPSTSATSVEKTKATSTTTISTTPSIATPVTAQDPSKATDITAGKVPAQLAAEGVKKTSVSKVAEQGHLEAVSSSDSESDSASTEEQKIRLRKTSSTVNAPSALAQGTSVGDIKSPSPEQAIASDTNLAAAESNFTETRPKSHRGSSLSHASAEEIKAVEEKNAIKEEPEEETSIATSSGNTGITAAHSSTKSKVEATDEAEAKAMKGSKPQDQKAKDADAAGLSAATAMFLAPIHDPKANRLSADSASVYSFFDTAFSPAPLFSGSKNLDLDLSFMQDIGKPDLRASISTYDSEPGEMNDMDRSTVNTEFQKATTPRLDDENQSSPQILQQSPTPDGSPRREILPTVPVIAPLRTPARRQVSEPLPSSAENRMSSASSVPLPLTIRKSPTPSPDQPTVSKQSPLPSGTNPQLQTSHLHTAQPSASPTSLYSDYTAHDTSSPSVATPSTPLSVFNNNSSHTQPASPSSSPAPLESRSLRFKKSIRSLRSKKSTQRLNTADGSSDVESSPPMPHMPPNLPPQRQLKDMTRSISENYTASTASRKAGSGSPRAREKSSMKNLLCF